MNLKFKKTSMIDTATIGASAVAGGLLSKGAMSIAPAEMKTPLVKGAVAILSLVGVASIQGQGQAANAVRGMLLGAGIENTQNAIKSVVAPTLPTGDEEATGSQKFVKAMFGLNAAEEAGTYSYQSNNYMIPSSVWDTPVIDDKNLGFAAI